MDSGAAFAPMMFIVAVALVGFMWLGALVTGVVLRKLGQGDVSLEGRLFVFFIFLLATGLTTKVAVAAWHGVQGLARR